MLSIAMVILETSIELRVDFIKPTLSKGVLILELIILFLLKHSANISSASSTLMSTNGIKQSILIMNFFRFYHNRNYSF